MKKIFLIITLAISCIYSQAQQWTKVNGRWEYQFLKTDSTFTPPQDTLSIAPIGSLAVKNDIVYFKNNYGYWNTLTSLPSIQQVLTAGDTSLRKIVFKDTGSTTADHSVRFAVIRPSNYGISYNSHRAGLFTSHGISYVTGVNVDGRPNVIGTMWGYNVDEGGNRLDTNEAAFRFGTETNYDLGVTNDPSFELHLPEVTIYNGYSFRPFTMYIRKNSGFTNTNMQINQLNLLRQTDHNFTFYSVVDNNHSTEVTYASDDDTKTHKIDFALPSSIGTINYADGGFGISSNVPTGRTISTNLRFTYGSPTNFCGTDGYGNSVIREGESIIMNTGSNTNFADWQFNSIQKYNFTSAFANFEAPILMNYQDIVTIGTAKIRATSGSTLTFQSNESGAGGDIDFINGTDGARTMTLYSAASGDPTNVTIGHTATNPGHLLEVIGSVVVDSNLYVKMFDIASNSDSAVVWDRSTNKLKVAKVNDPKVLRGILSSFTFPSISGGASTSTTVVVTGAVAGDLVLIQDAAGGALTDGEFFDARVSANDTVTIRRSYTVAGTIASSTKTYNVMVLKY